jgi:TldD protein
MLDKEQNFAFMRNLINRVPSKYYADVLFNATSSTLIAKSISDETIQTIPKIYGYVFRIFDGIQWWEIADDDPQALEIRAIKCIEKTVHSEAIKLQQFSASNLDYQFPMKRDLLNISLDEKLLFLRQTYLNIQNADSRVINPVVSYRDAITESCFVNTEGSFLRQIIPRVRVMLKPVVKIENKSDFDYFIVNKLGGFELTDEITLEIIKETVQNSIELTVAPLPPSGVSPVILDPGMAGIVAHESFGHGLEADQIIRERSYLAAYYKQTVASEIVNISDSPLESNSAGSYQFDDEGIIAKKTALVKDGIFNCFLHTRLTATILNEDPCGNGRRESVFNPVYPRMSNTFFEPGDYTLDEMIREMKDGVLLEKGYFGMEDPLGGGIQVTSRKGYLIKNGQRSKLVKGITLSGDVLPLLNNIDAISKGPIVLDGGTCGKGTEDHVPVTSGGVFIRVIKAVIGPG